MRRFGGSPDGLLSRSRSRFLSLVRGSPPCPFVRPFMVDGKEGEGILRLVRLISHLRLPPMCRSDYEAVGMPSFLKIASVLLSKNCFHSTGVRCIIVQDYYEIFGVPKNSSEDDIKKSFHALAKKYHPDANRNNPAAKRKFQEIRQAYETLRDSGKRAQYDKELNANQEKHTVCDGGFENYNRSPFTDSFYSIFSEIWQDERETFAMNIEVELLLSFIEAAKGCTKRLHFIANVSCESCDGSGYPATAKPNVCTTCGGTGRITVIPFTSRCSACKGRGHIIKDRCHTCGGSGVVKSMKNVDVSIPPGVDSGDIIRVPKAGNSGGRGVHPGKLIIKLRVDKDPIFSRAGADIYVDCNISFTKAILGGRIQVLTLFEKTEIKIPKGVQPGHLLILRGKGLPKGIGFVDHGDQYVRFCIQFPVSINERQKSLLEEFGREEEILERSGYAGENRWKRIVDRWDMYTMYVALAYIVGFLVSKLFTAL